MDYEILKNRLINGTPYTLESAMSRINALADNLMITQAEAEELIGLAQQYGSATPLEDTDARLNSLEQQLLELQGGVIELGGLCAQLLEGGDI